MAAPIRNTKEDPQAMHNILRNLAPQDQVEAFTGFQELLTIGGRIPIQDTMTGLTLFEQEVVRHTLAGTRIISPGQEMEPSNLPPNSFLVLQDGHVGHVSILAPGDNPIYPFEGYVDEKEGKKDHYSYRGIITLEPEKYESFLALKKREEEQFEREAQEATDALTAMPPEQLNRVLVDIHNGLTRMPPTSVYVRHTRFATFDEAINNTNTRRPDPDHPHNPPRLLDRLPHTPLNEWSVEEKVYIYGAYVLLNSGGQTRIEEMNGQQFTPGTLHAFFDAKASKYAAALKIPVPDNFSGFPLIKKARWIKQQLPEIDARFQRYRDIDGGTLGRKEEFYDPREYPPNNQIQDEISQQIEGVFHIKRKEGETSEAYWVRVTQEVIERDRDKNPDDSSSNLNLLIYTIVNAAAEKMDAIAMSRAFRSVDKIRQEGMLALEKPEQFYCCVAPSNKMIARYETEGKSDYLPEDLSAISARMEYNSWHLFVPQKQYLRKLAWRFSNVYLRMFKRDHYYAPILPDKATQSHHFHAGHIKAGVAHTIRYPGVSTFTTPEGELSINGGYDIRLSRREGQQPFTFQDLITTREYVNAIGKVRDTIINADPPVIIQGFNKKWYTSGEWMKYKNVMNSVAA